MRHGWSRLRISVWVFVGLAAVAEVFNLMNLVGLASHPAWLAVHGVLAALHDLESQLADQTERVSAQRKYWVIGGVLLVVALTCSIVWGIKVWLSATP